MTTVPLLPARPVAFPNPELALEEPDGLVAAGGELTQEWLLEAYSHGIFPWFDSDDDHILWWSPSLRAVLIPGEMHVGRSLGKRIRNGGFHLTADTAFDQVITACSAPRDDASGTWITPNMIAAYRQLHVAGYAHSIEVWHQEQLCGGLYGIALGKVFCGESMFSQAKDASKVAFYALQLHLQRQNFSLIDAQIMNPHLQSLGVKNMPRASFLEVLEHNRTLPTDTSMWQLD